MKRIAFYVIVCVLFVGCVNSIINEMGGVSYLNGIPSRVMVSLDEEMTRVELNEAMQTVWTKGDEVSVFYDTTANNRFSYMGETGAVSGELVRETADVGSEVLDRVVAIYPYDDEYVIDPATECITMNIPATQHYKEGSFGVGESVMLYAGGGDSFKFRNVCGVLRLPLRGVGDVTSITLMGNNNELLAGRAELNYATLGLSFEGSATESLRTLVLDCDDGVTLDPVDVTDFYFVVAPQCFDKGFAIDVEFTDGTVVRKSTSNSITIKRSTIQPMGVVDTIDERLDVATMPLIMTIPEVVYEEESDDVVVLVNGKGTAIEGYEGELYAHTGVITSMSTSHSDWRYTKADWSNNTEACKLLNRGNDIWQFTIKGGVRDFYGVPADEEILYGVFVFRSADGSVKLKDGDGDIFMPVSSYAVEASQMLNVLPREFDENTTQDVVITLNTAGTALDGYTGSVYAHTGVLTSRSTSTSDWKYVKSSWNNNIEACHLTKIGDNKYQYVIEGGPRAFYGVPEGENIEYLAFVFRSSDGSKQVRDCGNDILVYVDNALTRRPLGAKGVVTMNGNSATFVLYAPGKSSVNLLGDFNDYSTTATQMKKDGDYFWVTVDGLQLGKEYSYQYLVDGSVRVGDPYAEKVLDPWNDKWISTAVYPNPMTYPSGGEDMVSVFETSPRPYVWSVSKFDRPAVKTLAIYELLLRDFTTEGSINGALEKLDYLDDLGINAIELMPIQEFDGNDSWGYNTCYYFAPDKAYGTKRDVKRFIDECHKRGIAVILDVAINHATGQFPYAKMWWNSSANKTASNNPFFNVDATHNWSVYHDFNHTYSATRDYFKEVLKFWITEYKIDGYRFDLSKGFVQHPGDYDASGYSQERVDIISDYVNAIKAVDKDVYIILEHFCEQYEEDYLYSSLGAMCWNNSQLNGYMESVMGWSGNSDFSNFKSGRVNNIETHDEERLAYKAKTYGQDWVKNDWSKISKRLQAAYALHFLTPYPKMMWQFGELGYDISVEDGGRTSKKPIKWEYLNDSNRRALYDALSKIISFRTSRPDIYNVDNIPVHAWHVGDDSIGGKHLVMDKVIVVANFSNSHVSFNISVPKPGTWTNLMTGAKLTLGSTYNVSLSGSDYIILVRD